MNRLLKLGLTLGIVVSCIFSSIGAYAMPVVKSPYIPKNLEVSKTANNNYSIQVGANAVSLGNSTTSFTPQVTLPCWQGYAWNASIGLSMAVPANALAAANMTSSNDSKSISASNSYFGITYSGIATKEGFNETGGIDMTITIKQNIGNTLAFTYNKTNVNAYLQPSLTKEWIVGQDLENGRTVKSVTDTDVTDNLGQVVAHRPDYVVNAVAFYNTIGGGAVTKEQAATGLTTGQIGILYRMKVTDAKNNTTWADWSIPNGTNLWLTIPSAFLVSAIYPIIISPAGDTFGYTTAGASACQGGNLVMRTADVVTGAVGTGVSMSVRAYNASGVSRNFQLAVYTNDSPNAKVTNSNTPSIAVPNNGDTWYTGTYVSAPTFAAVPYYMYWNCDSIYPYVKYNSGTANARYKAQTYNTWAATYAPTDLGISCLYSIYVTYTASGTYNLTNSPSSIDFGVIQPNTKYYAYGSAPSNPITDGQCTFMITNSQSNAIKINIQATNFTGGDGWTLGAPDGTHSRLIAYYSGQNPASGVTLTTSDQVFIASLAGSATLKWDFSWETATSFADGTQKSSTITLTGLVP